MANFKYVINMAPKDFFKYKLAFKKKKKVTGGTARVWGEKGAGCEQKV